MGSTSCMEVSHLVEVTHLMEVLCLENTTFRQNATRGKSISTKEFSKLHAKYDGLLCVDELVNEDIIEWYCTSIYVIFQQYLINYKNV